MIMIIFETRLCGVVANVLNEFQLQSLGYLLFRTISFLHAFLITCKWFCYIDIYTNMAMCKMGKMDIEC